MTHGVGGEPAVGEARHTGDPRRGRQGTVLFQDASTAEGVCADRPVSAISPARLADLMLFAPSARRGGFSLLEPDGETSTMSLVKGTLTVAEIRVSADVGAAAVTRLAVLAGLDPLAEVRSLEGRANTARVMVSAGRDVAEMLVSVGASVRGLVAEVRLLSIDDHASDLRAPGPLKRCVRCGVLQAAAREACEDDGGTLVEVDDDPAPGGTIGSYRVLARLGEGGQGSVLSGEHALLGRPVAIKVLHRNVAQDLELSRRFLSEARAVSRLRHPGVVEITDFGVLREGHPYMVMERLTGDPLDALLARAGALDPEVALLVARQIAEALGAAHESGIAHNDLKPSNVMVLDGAIDRALKLKLIDFGAASLLGTTEALLYGTPGYMAPERILGEASDGRADLYALGMMLYEMLAGDTPLKAPTARALLLVHLREPIPPLRSPRCILPHALVCLVSRAVAKKPDARHQSTGEIIADIDRVLSILARPIWRRSWL